MQVVSISVMLRNTLSIGRVMPIASLYPSPRALLTCESRDNIIKGPASLVLNNRQ